MPSLEALSKLHIFIGRLFMSPRRSDFQDSFHDDPEIFEGESAQKAPFTRLALIALAIGGVFFVQTTLAADITISTGTPVEFGQGVLQATACSGANQISITPNVEFINASDAGTFKFKSITVSGVPSDCIGSDFTLSAYGDTSATKLALFNSTSTDLVIHNNAGTFEAGIGSTGLTVTGSAGSFTVNFDSPVALTSTVYKVTIQSGPHTVITCALGGSCSIDDIGPGGGTIYYYNASGFSCGAAYSGTGSPAGGLCHYLEVAPNTWSGGSTDGAKAWATSANAYTDIAGIPNDGKVRPYPGLSATSIGLGFKNSELIVAQGNDATSAAGAARAYNGGSKSDWYLPTMTELNLLCQWSKGNTISVTTPCTGGALVKGNLEPSAYKSSSEASADWAWYIFLSTNYLNSAGKAGLDYVRPIRAF